MSVDPSTLRKDDRVRFGGEIVKGVHEVYKYPDCGWKFISFEDGSGLRSIDKLWKLAELIKPKLPDLLYLAKLDDSGCYYGVHGIKVSPRALINLLRRDLATLEAAGIGKEEE